MIRTRLCICREESKTQIASEQVVKRLEIAISSLATPYDLLVGMEITINKLREQMQENARRQKDDKKAIESLRKENAKKVEEVNNMKAYKYKWGKAADKERKKVSEELTRMRLENSKSKIEANDKINIATRLERKLSTVTLGLKHTTYSHEAQWASKGTFQKK